MAQADQSHLIHYFFLLITIRSLQFPILCITESKTSATASPICSSVVVLYQEILCFLMKIRKLHFSFFFFFTYEVEQEMSVSLLQRKPVMLAIEC